MTDPLAVPDWRRRVFELYARIRANPDPQAARDDWRATRDRMVRTHDASPLPPDSRGAFAGFDLWPYDPALRFAVDVEPAEGDRLVFDLGDDGRMSARPLARTRGLPPGELTLWWIEGYGGGLFLPFLDATSGTESYGGGRYLIDAIKGADLGRDDAGRLILDFNFAYAPSCAMSPRWVCPLAPRENRLDIPVRAGERLRPAPA